MTPVAAKVPKLRLNNAVFDATVADGLLTSIPLPPLETLPAMSVFVGAASTASPLNALPVAEFPVSCVPIQLPRTSTPEL